MTMPFEDIEELLLDLNELDLEPDFVSKHFTNAPKELVRILTGKKMRSARHRYETELSKGTRLLQLGVPYPRILKADPGERIICYQRIMGKNLWEAFESIDPELRVHYIERILTLMRYCHDNGVVLGDTVLKNFMTRGRSVWIIDLENEWRGKNPKMLDVLMFASDVYFHSKDPSILEEVRVHYGEFTGEKVSWYMLLQFAIRFGIGPEFFSFFRNG
jgi:tRNA A-37 threonylcarbamoyl transferase component Bud32